MKKNGNQPSQLREGILASLPIFMGYIPVAVTFGLLAKSTGVTLLETFLFSALVFAGASQFMALQLIQMGVSPIQIIAVTFIMNFRHFLMSSYLSTFFPEPNHSLLPFISFGVTDESFAYLATRKEHPGHHFVLGLQYSAYVSWVGGTMIGFLAGAIIPRTLQVSMGLALYALFIAILIPEVKKSVPAAITAITGGLIHSLLTRSKYFSSGWNIIIAILVAAGVGSLLMNEKEGEDR
ncbi:MAG: AzlC family ABC transporter permease [Atribacterota bacterium]